MSVLSKLVLILNKGWNVVGVKSVQKSIIKVFSGTAKFLDPETYQLYDFYSWSKLGMTNTDTYHPIQMTHGQLRAPEIIVLTSYNGFRVNEIRLNKKNLLIRDHFCCAYTGKSLTLKTATIDHIIPKSRGGKTIWNNVVICCKEINRKKANKSPEEIGLKLIRTPHKPKWSPLFAYCVKDRPSSWDKFLNVNVEKSELVTSA